MIDLETGTDGTLYLVGFLQTFAPEGERQDVFVRRYQPDGTYTLNTVYGEAGLEIPTTLAVQSASEFYITGSTNGPVNGTNSGSYDGFLMRINEQGELVWTR